MTREEAPTDVCRWGLRSNRVRDGGRAALDPRTGLQVRLDLGGDVFPVLGMYAEEVPDEGQC